MKEISYIVYQEEKYYVAQCLNVDVSSFGETIDEAISNLKEAVELYLEGEDVNIPDIGKVIVGKDRVRG
ncbi:MAG: type II toxin-antitoxin system HicB family antitoxin [Thermodesulfobacteriota bacterium]